MNKRIFNSKPEYGDLVVFKTPSDNRTDFIKRLIGFPGDEIQIVEGELFINKQKYPKKNQLIILILDVEIALTKLLLMKKNCQIKKPT